MYAGHPNPAADWAPPEPSFAGVPTQWDGSPSLGFDDPYQLNFGAFETQVEVDFAPTTAAQIEDIKDTVAESVDKLTTTVGTASKLAAATILGATFLGAAALLLRK